MEQTPQCQAETDTRQHVSEQDHDWHRFAMQADKVAEHADALLLLARKIGNPSAITAARSIRDGALDLYNRYNS